MLLLHTFLSNKKILNYKTIQLCNALHIKVNPLKNKLFFSFLFCSVFLFDAFIFILLKEKNNPFHSFLLDKFSKSILINYNFDVIFINNKKHKHYGNYLS